ncbi:CmcJ/NvfI family oxidoreductase, partial [Acinetobacter baumannii]
YNPAHRWYYVPRMTADEALLLKCYDSATDGRTRFCPHTAFVDPTTPADAAPRESIEVRTLVFHKH